MVCFSSSEFRFGRAAGVIALAGAAFIVALPAVAADDDANAMNASNNAPSTQYDTSISSQPQSDKDKTDDTRSGDQANQNTPPSQRLPEPKPNDYGTSSFHAPNDAELDRFAATHQPPDADSNRAQNQSGEGISQPNPSGAAAADSLNSANGHGPSMDTPSTDNSDNSSVDNTEFNDAGSRSSD